MKVIVVLLLYLLDCLDSLRNSSLHRIDFVCLCVEICVSNMHSINCFIYCVLLIVVSFLDFSLGDLHFI